MPGEAPPAKCPTCRRPTPREGEHAPFCSDRCRLVDLGRWFRGDYVVSRPLRPGEGPAEGEEPAEGEKPAEGE